MPRVKEHFTFANKLHVGLSCTVVGGKMSRLNLLTIHTPLLWFDELFENDKFGQCFLYINLECTAIETLLTRNFSKYHLAVPT